MMLPQRSGGASTALQGGSAQGAPPSSSFMLNSSGIDSSQSVGVSQILSSGTQQNKKSQSKQRAGGAATSQGMVSTNNHGTVFQHINNTSGSLAASSGHRGSEGSGMPQNVSVMMHHHHNQTAKIPQHYLANVGKAGQGATGIMMVPSNMTAALSAVGVPPHSSMSMNSGGPLVDKNLSASQKKRISLKKLEEEYCKTIEQIGSPNSSTINLENMKKTQSLHYMRAGSGASSPQQIKSRTSIGKYGQQNHQVGPGSALGGAIGGIPGMNGIYNNYNNPQAHQQQHHQQINSQQRTSFVGKQQSQLGIHGQGGQINQQPLVGNGMGTGNRSRSKTTNRKKRNLYTSMGNYYQSQQPTANLNNQGGAASAPGTNNSASRATKRVHQQNFLDNLEQTNMLMGGNLAAAHHMLLQEDPMSKKRNKSSTKSYNNKELLDHNNSSEICYSSHLTKKNPLTNNFFDVSQFSSNHGSIAKNFENSFQFSAGGFLPNSGKQTTATASLSAVSANKQRPTSSHKSALMVAAGGNSSSVKPIQKKKAQGTLRKSVNSSNVIPGGGSNSAHYNSNNLMNSSANYGQQLLHQNAYDFLSNASLILNSSKAARRPKNNGGGNSAIDSRCSQNKDSHVGTGLGLVKSQVASNTAFGHQQLNNTSHTTICSNRKIGAQGEIVSGKKNSLQQQQMLQQNYLSLANHQQTSDMHTAGEISSDRQTLKMNDFLKQIEAYSNDKLDKFMPHSQSNGQQQQQVNHHGQQPQMSQSAGGNYHMSQQAKIAEQVKIIIDREMSAMQVVVPGRTSNSKQRYTNDESRGGAESGNDRNLDIGDDEEDNEDQTTRQQQPDYEHLLNVISDSFNSLISTFYQNGAVPIIGVSLARIKESYEEIINSIVENLSQQIESQQSDLEQMSEENSIIKERNSFLENNSQNQEINSQQVASYARQNEALAEELNRLMEENKVLKRDQKDRDSQLIESMKIIEKLSASQKQLHSQSNFNHNSSGSSKAAARLANNESQFHQSSKGGGVGKFSATSVPPLNLGKLQKVQQQQPPNLQPLMSNDSQQTLDRAQLLNANLQEPSQSSVAHHDGSRMLEELYSNNHHHQQQQPFNVNQSDISYVNSEEGEVDVEAAYLNSGGKGDPNSQQHNHHLNHHHPGGIFNQSGRQSSIAQDKSPIMKPFIPPLNLNKVNNPISQAANLGQQQPQQQMPQPQALPQTKTNPKLKLDLSSVSNNQQQQQPASTASQLNNSHLDQDSSSAEYHHDQRGPAPNIPPPHPAKIGGLGLGLNLANLKQQRGIIDFQDEFNAKYDEYSESWRNAMNREKRF